MEKEQAKKFLSATERILKDLQEHEDSDSKKNAINFLKRHKKELQKTIKGEK